MKKFFKVNFNSISFESLIFLFITGVFLLVTSCENNRLVKTDRKDDFSFVFLTDIHLQPENNAIKGFQQVIDTINKINPDFVLTGGDLIMDALGQNFKRADSLYNIYTRMIKGFNMPVYNTMGNHEVFGLYKNSGIDTSHPEYNKKMYENRIGDRYYSFAFKNWHFMVLDGIGQTAERKYIGEIDSVQINWIKEELSGIDTAKPIVLSTHIPFVTIMPQLKVGSLTPNTEGLVVKNSKEVLELFKEHNLKLVLQGHLHYLEDIYADGVHFVTGGAVSGKWWKGPHYNVEEGFLKIDVSGDEFEWNYFEYGWEVK